MFPNEPLVLTEGAITERLRRMPGMNLDPHVEHAALVYEGRGREILKGLYRDYLDVGRAHDLPIIVLTPTRRADPSRIERAGLTASLYRDCVALLAEVREEYGTYARRIAIGGLIGCVGDAYLPEQALGLAEAAASHREQLEALADAGADLLIGATLPAYSEAAGLARAMADLGRPWLLSFVIRPEGTLLDNIPLADAVRRIDDDVDRAPAGYLANCVHPSIFRRAVEAAGIDGRLLGLMANTSARSPAELEGRAELDTMDPEDFGVAMARLHEDLGTRIMGGCCGTDGRHLEALARRCSSLANRRSSIMS